MFLSQKGSLGRNPMINRVGQRLLQLFEGASAAYSLRDLASNIASVVRVRRASDNSEKDFSAADVSSGAMTQWVNGQVVPPLDVRELVDGHRTGALVPAAAAYSLRSLSASYTGSVVDVRRSSDDSIGTFTAAEVADGTLADWVNINTLSTARNYTTQPFETFTGASSSGFTASNSSDNGFAGWDINSGVSGDVIKVSFDLNVISGSPKISFRQAYNNSIQASNENIEYTTSGSYTATLTASGNFSFIAFTEGDIPSSFTVSNFKILADGFVSQWTDQSGNGNHATQGTPASQPKIVSGGVLVSGGIDFDGVDNGLEFDEGSVITNLDDFSSFTVAKSDTAVGTRVALSVSDNTPNASRWYSPILIGGNFTFGYGTSATAVSLGVADINEHLFSSIAGSTTAEAWKDGTSGGSVSSITTAPSKIAGINLGGSNNALFWNGCVKEIILYDSDQSANRTAFEANIGETYGIDLPSGVDTGYDQVDGFVETWYDQSGNGNDAVQETAGNQPKIVDAGVLVSGGIDFDGVDDVLEVTSAISSNGQADTTIFVAKLVDNAATYGFCDNYSTADPHFIRGAATDFGAFLGSTSNISYATVNTDENLHFVQKASISNQSFGSLNGVTNSFNAGTDGYTGGVTIGASRISSAFLKGSIREFIIYASDQSANREAIEANINNQYDIY